MTTQALTRNGREPNRTGRTGVSEAMGRLLDEGRRFTDPTAELDPADLRSWAGRLRQLAGDLADCVEAPERNRVMEMLASTSVPDDLCALTALRINISGSSYGQLGEETGVAGKTIERIEGGAGCQARVAFKLAERFALSPTELFYFDDPSDKSRCRTVGDLRDVLEHGDGLDLPEPD